MTWIDSNIGNRSDIIDYIVTSLSANNICSILEQECVVGNNKLITHTFEQAMRMWFDEVLPNVEHIDLVRK